MTLVFLKRLLNQFISNFKYFTLKNGFNIMSLLLQFCLLNADDRSNLLNGHYINNRFFVMKWRQISFDLRIY